jgi:UDP-N-acetylmuramoylalanine--D-glutamate ligase
MPNSMASTTALNDDKHLAHDWGGRRVTLMGLGRHGGGLGAAQYLAQRGAILTISDSGDAAALSASLAALADLPIQAVHVGQHDPSDFQNADVVVMNPAVRPDHPCLQIARAAGATLTSEIELFLERCPGRVIGVTGSNGKSTTVTMLAEILRAAGRTTWLGGNLGGSLLGDLDRMTADDWVVLEFSSFQLAHLSEHAVLPEISLITNCTPNHLDWHGDFAVYAAAKKRLLGAQQVVLNACDPATNRWLVDASGGTTASWSLDRIPTLHVPGDHNRQNAACAAATAELAGIQETHIAAALANFRGLEHRIEWVGELRGRHFYNDSKSTSPGATLAAIAALDRPTWLLAGGVSKGTDFTELAAQVVTLTRGAALFGSARRELHDCLKCARDDFPAACHETLADSLAWCIEQSATGEAILLSPACASFDQFQDFGDRGRVFRRLIAELR